MIRFEHPELETLVLRLSPTKVEWTYNLNTKLTNTYGGQIIQILSINFDKLVLEGMFGKEGPHGKTLDKKEGLVPRGGNQLWDYESIEAQQEYAIGLTQMTAFFQDYFAIASQGGDNRHPGIHYTQEPMTVTYTGALDDKNFPAGEREWKVYPISFPSYSRSLKEFAPKWRMEFEIEQPDWKVKDSSVEQQLKNIRTQIGYEPYWEFSDPVREYAKENRISSIVQAESAFRNYIVQQFDFIMEWIPTLTPDEYTDLLTTGIALPLIVKNARPQGADAQNPGGGDNGIRTDTSKPPAGQDPFRGQEKGPGV